MIFRGTGYLNIFEPSPLLALLVLRCLARAVSDFPRKSPFSTAFRVVGGVGGAMKFKSIQHLHYEKKQCHVTLLDIARKLQVMSRY